MSNTAMKYFLHVLVYFAVSKLAMSGDTSTISPDKVAEREPFSVPPEQQESNGTFQSDMQLTLQQAVDIVESAHGSRRAVQTGYWPDAKVVYQIDENFGEEMVAKIKEAMEWWTDSTCITFEKYVPSTTSDTDHRVLFAKGNNGCYSDVGMVSSIPQYIHLQEDVCDVTGTIAHEIGHTVGWWHEQARKDRDKYITIRFENIMEGEEKEFVQHDTVNYGVPYDTESIMHYASTYYTKNGHVTIEPHEALEVFKMGNRKYFTFFDKKLANVMYNCSAACTNDLECENDGYVGQDCICHCKPGYIGDRCQLYNAEDVEGPCYREFEAEIDSDQQLFSPNYPHAYDNNVYCPWILTAPEGCTVTFTFAFLETEGGKCLSDYVKIRNGSDIFYGGDRYCGDTLPSSPIESVGNQMVVIFKSDGSGQYRGFSALYRASLGPTVSPTSGPATTLPEEPTTLPLATPKPVTPKCPDVEGTCGGTFTGDSGCIASPNFGSGQYNNNEECVYHLSVTSGQRVLMRIEKLDVEAQETCIWDRVVVIPGETQGSVRVCGESVPEGIFVSLDNTMTVKMISDALVSKGGFVAHFQGITLN